MLLNALLSFCPLEKSCCPQHAESQVVVEVEIVVTRIVEAILAVGYIMDEIINIFIYILLMAYKLYISVRRKMG